MHRCCRMLPIYKEMYKVILGSAIRSKYLAKTKRILSHCLHRNRLMSKMRISANIVEISI